MACGGCRGARGQAYTGVGQVMRGQVRTGLGNLAGAARDAVQINVAKVRGTYDYSAYKATPYRRVPERTTTH